MKKTSTRLLASAVPSSTGWVLEVMPSVLLKPVSVAAVILSTAFSALVSTVKL